MADVTKNPAIHGGALAREFRSVVSLVKSRRTVALAYVSMFSMVVLNLFLAFSSGSDERCQVSPAFPYEQKARTVTVTPPPPPPPPPPPLSRAEEAQSVAPAKKGRKESDRWIESLMNCDMSDGDWVKDDSYPLYKPSSCKFIEEQYSCTSNGRPDEDYLHYRWKPSGCTLPRLDANRFLEMLRGKRMVFVGDSLNKSMWESMLCILRTAVKDVKNVFRAPHRNSFVVFKDYNLTVEYYLSHFLVQELEIKDKKRLQIDLIGKTSDDLNGADILIFSTGHWWVPDKTSKGKDFFQKGNHVYPELNILKAFRRGLTTWARWVDENVDRSKSLVFFQGMSAQHFSGGQWHSGGSCDKETEPIRNRAYLTAYPEKMTVAEEVLKGMKTHVSYLNITRMTDYRKDGHPSVYRRTKVAGAELKSPLVHQDCGHWCLPGVPDVWNELIYAELLVREHQKELM